jgi:alpha-ketoglutarate-dependent taurine dioxygenase
LKTSFLPGLPRLPLVVEPAGSASVSTLLQELGSERAWIDQQLLKYGAILFRGYEIHGSVEFQRVVTHLVDEIVDYTRGASPRSKVSGKIYTSTDAPKMIPIPLHCELSYTPCPPNRILFLCQTPAQKGGETPIADMRTVYQSLDSDVRQRLEERGLRLIQNVPSKKVFDFSKTWQEMFATHDRREVEKACEAMEIACAWKNNGSLQLVNFCSAFMAHPVTGDQVLFTSFYNFHDSWSDELKLYDLYWLSKVVGVFELFRQRTRMSAVDYPHHSTFSDGSEIPRSDVLHVRKVLRDHAVSFPWQRGDFIIIDNFRVSHGRMPFKGDRKILVSMGNSVLSQQGL